MPPFRPLVRLVPRSFARLSAQTARRPADYLRGPSVTRLAHRPTPFLGSLATFHTSVARRQEADDEGVDQELAAKLAQELELEREARDPEEPLPSTIQEYLDNSDFELQDSPGQDDVHLVRTFGEETIKVTFTIADFGLQDHEDPDRALFDEEDPNEMMDTQSGGANTKGAINQGVKGDGNIRVAPEDSVAPADRPELAEEDSFAQDEESFPCRLTITISKPQKGALVLEAVTQDGDTVVNDMAYFPTMELAESKTAEKDWERKSLYSGPPFGNLDEDLQNLVTRYLEERGINTSMALFIPEYIDHKEQREYIKWLESVKNFIE